LLTGIIKYSFGEGSDKDSNLPLKNRQTGPDTYLDHAPENIKLPE